jgi:ankyrin repeat protein
MHKTQKDIIALTLTVNCPKFYMTVRIYSPLHYAVREGREEVVKQLIRAGSDLNIKVKIQACCILNNNINIQSNAKLGIIHIAARWSSVQMCSLLIDSGY